MLGEVAGRPVHDGLAEVLLLEFTEFDAQLDTHHRVPVAAREEGGLEDLDQVVEGVEGEGVDVVVGLLLLLLLLLHIFSRLFLLVLLKRVPSLILLLLCLFLFGDGLDGSGISG